MSVLDSLREFFEVGETPSKPAKGKKLQAAPAAKPTPIRKAFSSGYQDISDIATLDLNSFEEVNAISENILQNIPVVVNMANLSERDFNQVFYFMLGLKAGVQGNLKRITPKVYLLTPHAVSVNGDEETEDQDLIP